MNTYYNKSHFGLALITYLVSQIIYQNINLLNAIDFKKALLIQASNIDNSKNEKGI